MSSEDVVQNQIEVGGEEVPGEFVEAEGGGEEGDDEFGEDEGGDDEFGEDDRGGGEFGEDEGGDDDLGEDGGGGDDLGEDEGRGDDLGEDEGGDDDLGEDEGGYDDLGEDEGGDDDLGEDEGGDDDLGEDEGGGDELGEGEESGDEFEEDERGSANIAEGGGGDVLSDEGGSEEEAGVALQLRGSGKSWRQAEGESSGEELRSPLEVVGDQDRLEPKVSGEGLFSETVPLVSGERATRLGSAVRFAAASWHIDEDVSRRTIRGDYQLSEIFLRCMCFKYPDMKRKDLVLRGDELYKRIGRRINDVDIETICEFVKTHPEVVGLDLSYNRITENGASYLFYFLTGNKCLESLNLMDNNIRNVDVLQEMGADLHLKTLRLKGNELEKKLGMNYDPDSIAEDGDMPKPVRTRELRPRDDRPRMLHAPLMNWVVQGGMAIARLVEETMTLEVVDVGQTEQDVYSLVHLTNALAFNRTLTVVDLSGLLSRLYYQAHTDHFARLIGNMLKFNTTLVELHLEKNGLTDHDLEVMLWHGMEVNKTLQLIDLSANHIGDQGADILASYLDHTRQLKGIMLRSNMIRDTGARSLSFKLPFSKVILLDLSHNRIGDQGMVDLLLTLKKPFPLLAFFFFGNLFKERVIKLVHKLILAGELWNDAVDVVVYEVDGVYSCALNGFADQYRRRYYCLPSTTWPQVYRLRRYPPVLEHSLDFKYHNPIPKRVPVSWIEHSGRPPTEPSFRKTCSL
ncbi:hypothetical protein AAG570_011625 [Ranatra chinensis]|uniref:Uncharacterized protein n=1 Tax=Ranatra chinensis TaxID=642074 RepID=A0ABD0YL91_9HEMI